MITFERNNKKVKIEIQHGIFHNEDFFELEVHQNHEYQAELLRKAFQENLNRHIAVIKEKAYNEGWAAAKSKSKKKTEFYGGW